MKWKIFFDIQFAEKYKNRKVRHVFCQRPKGDHLHGNPCVSGTESAFFAVINVYCSSFTF